MVASKSQQVAALLSIALVVAPQAFAAPCANFDDTRNAAYMPYIQLVLGDLRTIDRSKGDAAFNAAVNALASKYSRGNTAEDVRKVIGIGLFNAMAVKGEPADTTFQLACRSARNKLPPVNGRVMDVDDVIFSWKRFADTSPSRGAVANAANPASPVLSPLRLGGSSSASVRPDATIFVCPPVASRSAPGKRTVTATCHSQRGVLR